MAIWMDMTNSMYIHQGGIVGIIRAELEIAKSMYRENPNVRFVMFRGRDFLEIEADSLQWLWDSDSVGDAYLTKMGRKQTDGLMVPRTNAGIDREEWKRRYPKLAAAYTHSDSRLLRMEEGLLLYAGTLPAGIKEIAKGLIKFLLWLPKKMSLFLAHRRVPKRTKQKARSSAQDESIKYPFSRGDVVFSCGWMDSGKEAGFERVKEQCDIKLMYLIYDIILVRSNTKQFYPVGADNLFHSYLHWIAMNCDSILYGGKTAQEDAEAYFQERNLPVRPGYPVYFGADIAKKRKFSQDSWQQYAAEIGLTGDYLLMVGSLDARKNYSTIYKAYTILADQGKNENLQVVIVGKGAACRELQERMARDPRTRGKIIITSPADEKLDWLYQKAKLFIIASAWEGWSLTLPEALQYGKMVLAADIAPLREIGESMVEYVDTYDPIEWAEKIDYFYRNDQARMNYEQKVKKNYLRISWQDCGVQVLSIIRDASNNQEKDLHTLYMDISLTVFAVMTGGNITGILRTELMCIKYLYKRFSNVRFFSLDGERGYQSIPAVLLADIITGEDQDCDFKKCREKIGPYVSYWAERHNAERYNGERIHQKEEAFWMLLSALPPKCYAKLIDFGKSRRCKMRAAPLQNRAGIDMTISEGVYDVPMEEGDVVFSAGTGSGMESFQKLLNTKEKKKFQYCGIVYDYTPVLLPQVHRKENTEYYIPFLEFTSKMYDIILYCGKVAQQDGIKYNREHGLAMPKSYGLIFGSDSSHKERGADPSFDRDVLKRMGIKRQYILTVGTMEPRKNHETLYHAYLRMLEKYEDVPQMVFAGHPGWNNDEFLATLRRDERVKGKIIQISPTDDELDVLYRNCTFTALPSLYEGASVALSESFWYHKFCLCCDTPPLREVAGDFAEYIHAWDEKVWCDRINYYYTHPDVLQSCCDQIAADYHAVSWDEFAENVAVHIRELMDCERES